MDSKNKTIHTQAQKNVTRGSNLGCTLSITRTACGFRQYAIANTWLHKLCTLLDG